MYMSAVVEDCSDPTLAMVIERQLFECFAYLARHAPYGEVLSDALLKRVVTRIPHPLMNGIYLAQLSRENMDQTIEETLDYFTSRNLPFTWRTGPSTRPPNLGERLEAHGFNHGRDTPGMVVDLSMIKDNLAKPSGLRIEPVEDVVTLRKYIQVAATSFGREFTPFIDNFVDIETRIGFTRFPPRRNYIGYLEGEPVACSTLLLAHGVAGIYTVGTIPEARRKGIGTEITLVPLREARDRGYHVGVIHPSEMALKVYQRIGFKEYCKIGVYRWLGETVQVAS